MLPPQLMPPYNKGAKYRGDRAISPARRSNHDDKGCLQTLAKSPSKGVRAAC